MLSPGVRGWYIVSRVVSMVLGLGLTRSGMLFFMAGVPSSLVKMVGASKPVSCSYPSFPFPAQPLGHKDTMSDVDNTGKE